MKADIMIDLETMGTDNNAAIIAIGAVKFDPEQKVIKSEFYCRVDLQSCLDVSLTITASTIMWWLQQSDQARDEFKGQLPSLKLALDGFSAWVMAGERDKNDIRMWGNGAVFDNVLLASAYKAMKMEKPWTYKGDRCYRTLRSLYPNVPFKGYGMKHNALHDAKAQALHLMDIWPLLRSA